VYLSTLLVFSCVSQCLNLCCVQYVYICLTCACGVQHHILSTHGPQAEDSLHPSLLSQSLSYGVGPLLLVSLSLFFWSCFGVWIWCFTQGIGKIRDSRKPLPLVGGKDKRRRCGCWGHSAEDGACPVGGKATKGMWPPPATLSKAESEGQYIPASLSPILPSPTGVKLSEGRGQPSGMQKREDNK